MASLLSCISATSSRRVASSDDNRDMLLIALLTNTAFRGELCDEPISSMKLEQATQAVCRIKVSYNDVVLIMKA